MRLAILNQEEVNMDFYVDLYDSVKNYSECPACYVVPTKDLLDVPNCGHLICKGCKDVICENEVR